MKYFTTSTILHEILLKKLKWVHFIIGYNFLIIYMYAFFAVGEKEDEENTGLLEPKEELLSGDEDNEDNEGEDEDEEVADEVAPEGGGGERPQLVPNESQQQSWPTADEPAAPAAVAKEEEAEEGSEELQHPRDEVVASDAAANANGHCKSSGKFDFNLHILLPLAERYIHVYLAYVCTYICMYVYTRI